MREQSWWLLALLLVLAVGGFFRFYQLGDIPSDPTGDHAQKLLDMHSLSEGERPIFFPRNGGREPAQFYVTFGLIKTLGLSLSFETLKIGTAFIGLLAIPAVFLFAKEVAGRATGLFAAALFAVSSWPVGTSRIGVRFPYGQLATALALWLLFRYIRRGDRRDALACGVVLGLGLHGYTSFRVVLLLVPVLLALAYLYRRQSEQAPLSSLATDSGIVLGTAFLACLPLARYAVDHPDLVTARTRTRLVRDPSIDGSQVDWAEAPLTFLDANVNALLAFNWRGDRIGRMNALLFEPFLDVMTGAALLAGLVIVGYNLIARRSFNSAALLVSIPILFLPSTLQLAVPLENPSVSRLGSAAPVVFTVAALPFAYLWEWLRRAGPESWHDKLRSRPSALVVTASVTLTALGIATHQNYVVYFRDYAHQYRDFEPNTQEIAAAIEARLRGGLALDDTYLLGYPHWVDASLVGFELGSPDWSETHNPGPDDPLPQPVPGRRLLFVLNPNDARRKGLEARYPTGVLTAVRSDRARGDFDLYSVPP